MNNRLVKKEGSKNVSPELDEVTVLNSVVLPEGGELQAVFPLEAKGRLLTQSRSKKDSIIFKIWERESKQEMHCLSQTELCSPTSQKIMYHYLPEGPVLSVTQDKVRINPATEFIYRATQDAFFYKNFKNSQDDNLSICSVCLLRPNEAAFLFRDKRANDLTKFFIYKKKGQVFEDSQAKNLFEDPTVVCSPTENLLAVGCSDAIDILSRAEDDSFILSKSILFQGDCDQNVFCRYTIREMQVISSETVLCMVGRQHYRSSSLAWLLIKVNIKNDSMVSLELPQGHVKDGWQMPTQFSSCPSLFFLTKVCTHLGFFSYSHYLFDANEMRLQTLPVGEFSVLQAILPDASLVMADARSFRVLEVKAIKRYFHYLDEQIKASLQEVLGVTVLQNEVASYLDRDVLAGDQYVNFFKRENLGRHLLRPSQLEEKHAKEEAPAGCRFM